MNRWRGRVAMVTGASAGIGAAIVRALVSHGMTVDGCARNVAKVKAIADELSGEPGSFLAIRCDLRNEEDILAMFEEIKKQYGGVDVCINNAGLRHFDCWSLAGHSALPQSSFYSGSKFAITALVEGIRTELRKAKSHIRITSISPGIVETEFVYKALRDNGRAQDWYTTNPVFVWKLSGNDYRTWVCALSGDTLGAREDLEDGHQCITGHEGFIGNCLNRHLESSYLNLSTMKATG